MKNFKEPNQKNEVFGTNKKKFNPRTLTLPQTRLQLHKVTYTREYKQVGFMFTLQALIQKCFEGQPWQPFTIYSYLCYLSKR
jgi:hypothetical protein